MRPWIGAVGVVAVTVAAAPGVPAATAATNLPPSAPTNITVDDARLENGVNYINYSTPVTCAKAIDPEGGRVKLEFGVWPSPTFPWRIWTSPEVASGQVICYALPQDAALTEFPYPAILKVRAQDAAGAWSTQPYTRVLVDKTPPPTPTIASGTLTPNAWGNAPSPVVEFIDNGDAASWSYSLDAGPSQTGSSTVSLSNLSPGYHHLEIVREDKAGNIAQSSFPFGVGPEVTACASAGFTSAEKTEFDSEVDALAVSGDLSSVTVAALKCQPAIADVGVTAPVAKTVDDALGPEAVGDASVTTAVGYSAGSVQALPEPRGITALAALATKCPTGAPRIVLEQKVWGALAWSFNIRVKYCYDGRRVSSVSTTRDARVTNWGKLIGIKFDSYGDDTKYYYSLNGVSNAAYRYTQVFRWSNGNRIGQFHWDCDAVITERVYGDGSHRKAGTKCN